MRIGYVLNAFPKLSETFVLNEMLALEREGHEVRVFALGYGRDARFHGTLSELQAPVVYLETSFDELLTRVSSVEFGQASVAGSLLAGGLGALVRRVGESDQSRPASRLRAALDLALAAEGESVDRLHAHFAGPAAEAAKLASGVLGIPWSLTCHAKDIYHRSVRPAALRWLTDDADRVVTVCDSNRRHLEAILSSQARNRLRTLYNGVDLERFHPGLRQENRQPTVLGVGRLVAKKGFDTLVSAAARLTTTTGAPRVRIVGDGREREALEAQMAIEGAVNVDLLGSLDQESVIREMARATIVALPCRIDDEGNRDALPTVLLEAAAMGIPAISTPVVGVPEIVLHERTGLLVPSDDPEALAQAIERLLGDAPLRERMGVAARRHAEERFNLTHNVSALTQELAPDRPVVAA